MWHQKADSAHRETVLACKLVLRASRESSSSSPTFLLHLTQKEEEGEPTLHSRAQLSRRNRVQQHRNWSPQALKCRHNSFWLWQQQLISRLYRRKKLSLKPSTSRSKWGTGHTHTHTDSQLYQLCSNHYNHHHHRHWPKETGSTCSVAERMQSKCTSFCPVLL